MRIFFQNLKGAAAAAAKIFQRFGWLQRAVCLCESRGGHSHAKKAKKTADPHMNTGGFAGY